MDKFLENLEGNLTFEQNLTKDEIEMFERLLAQEEVHNALGAMLGQFRESIVETRNRFVGHLCSKYRIPPEQQKHAAFDPISQKVVSTFHPNVKGHKIVSRSNAFSQLASELMVDAIKKLSEAQKIEKNVRSS